VQNDLSIGNTLTTIIAPIFGAKENIYYGQNGLINSGIGRSGEVCCRGKIAVKKIKKYFRFDIP
jgi:hypothetical protein